MEGAQQLAATGFNITLFDLELPSAEESKRPNREETQTQALIDRGNTNQAGNPFKTGTTVINGHV